MIVKDSVVNIVQRKKIVTIIYCQIHKGQDFSNRVTVKVKLLSHVWLFATSRTVGQQAPPSMGFPRQEYWSGDFFLQGRKNTGVGISFSRGSSRPKDQTRVSRIASRHFNLWATRETLSIRINAYKMFDMKILHWQTKTVFPCLLMWGRYSQKSVGCSVKLMEVLDTFSIPGQESKY